jgi:hypothetical protein
VPKLPIRAPIWPGDARGRASLPILRGRLAKLRHRIQRSSPPPGPPGNRGWRQPQSFLTVFADGAATFRSFHDADFCLDDRLSQRRGSKETRTSRDVDHRRAGKWFESSGTTFRCRLCEAWRSISPCSCC